MSIEAPQLEDQTALPQEPPAETRIVVETPDPVTRGGTRRGIAIGIAGTVAALAAYKGGVLPGIGGNTHVEVGPATITEVFQMDEACYAGFTALGGANAEIHAAVQTGDIPFINTGIHVDKEVPGAWFGEKVNGTVEEKICQDDQTVTMEYDTRDQTVTLAIPQSALHFVADMLAGKQVSDTTGPLFVSTENLSNEWKLLTGKGLPNAIDTMRSNLQSLAEMETIENIVESCTPELREYYEAAFVAHNADRILSQAKVFNVPLNRGNISVVFTGDGPKYVSRYDDQLKTMKSDKHMHLDVVKDGDCTPTEEVKDQMDRELKELHDTEKAFYKER